MKDDTLAAEALGKRYSEAIRRPGPRLEHDEDEARGSGLGMKTLADQVEDGEDEREAAQFRCANCGEVNRLRLPAGVRLAEDEDEEEAEGRRRFVQARCAGCGQAHRVEAPDGYRYAQTQEAARAFERSYRRHPKVFASSRRHAHLIGAMRVR
jgi:hypothetical protein